MNLIKNILTLFLAKAPEKKVDKPKTYIAHNS